MMLKRTSKLQLFNNGSRNHIQSTQRRSLQQMGINRLFQPPYREVFELSYLYSSPLCTYYPSFVEVIKMIENFNTETIAIEHYQPKYQNPLKILCMRFIYREMLSIAVMERNQIMQNDYATKLKNWYYELSQKHSFLEGINFKKRKNDEDKLQELIRKSYISNVFDEIDDYFRKRLGYEESTFQRTFQKESFLSSKRNTDESQLVNLPLIDIQLYRRQGQLLRNYREKQVQSKYFHDMRTNKNKMREVSLNNIKNRQFKNSIPTTQLKMPMNLVKSFHGALNDLKNDRINKSSKNLIGRFDTEDHPDWRKKPYDIQHMIQEKRSKNRLSLININGINLIHSKLE